jgi:integrase
MGKLRERAARRRRIGRVSIYRHRRRWWVYYREQGRPVRKAVADDAKAAEQVAAQINLELTASAPTLFSFRPVSIAERQPAFVDYHEHVVRSSLATVSRYGAATQHLVNFSGGEWAGGRRAAHEVDLEAFVRYRRTSANRQPACTIPFMRHKARQSNRVAITNDIDLRQIDRAKDWTKRSFRLPT